MKQIEIFIAKFRILLNDIELISYDIEQLKQSDYEDKQSIVVINHRWEDLLKQTNEKYHSLENQFEQMNIKQKLFEQLNLIDKQIQQSTINTKFNLLIERLEDIEQEINKEFLDDDELKSKYSKTSHSGHFAVRRNDFCWN
jgi:glycyl-tRNA synthetase beta subunit